MYPYAGVINAAASAAGVPAALLAAVAWRESGFNQMAVGDGGCSCSMFQLHWCGGAGYGYTCQQLQNDISLAASIAASYLRRCLDAFPGDLYRGVAAYRQGVGGVMANGPINLNNYITDILAKYQEYGGDVPPMPVTYASYIIVGIFLGAFLALGR